MRTSQELAPSCPLQPRCHTGARNLLLWGRTWICTLVQCCLKWKKKIAFSAGLEVSPSASCREQCSAVPGAVPPGCQWKITSSSLRKEIKTFLWEQQPTREGRGARREARTRRTSRVPSSGISSRLGKAEPSSSPAIPTLPFHAGAPHGAPAPLQLPTPQWRERNSSQHPSKKPPARQGCQQLSSSLPPQPPAPALLCFPAELLPPQHSHLTSFDKLRHCPNSLREAPVLQGKLLEVTGVLQVGVCLCIQGMHSWHSRLAKLCPT